MKIEHVAFNVSDPVTSAKWYVDNLGFTLKRSFETEPWGQFLADDSGTVMIELYKNSSAPLPNYAAMAPFTLHLALVSQDVDADVSRLTAAGATLVGTVQHNPGGDSMAFLRDPWGFTLQLVKRAVPMIPST